MSWREQVKFQWDDDEVRFVLDQHAEYDFHTPVSRRAVLCDWVWRAGGRAGGRPHRFPHNNFSSVYRIFPKLGHMIPLWKGKNSIYFGVIRSKVKVTITINRIVNNRVVSHDNFSSVYWILSKLGQMNSLWKVKNPVYFGVIRSKVKVTIAIYIIFDNRVVSAR